MANKVIGQGFHIASRDVPSAVVKTPEGSYDSNSTKATARRRVQIGKTSHEIYPWDTDNRLPNRMIDLYRTNGDVMNLVQTRIDFLYGSGPGWYQHKMDGKDLLLVPFSNSATEEFGDLNDVPDVVNTMLTYFGETGNAFVNLSQNQSLHELNLCDSLTVRACVATGRQVDKWILAADWSKPKNAVVVPSWAKDQTKAPETLYQIKTRQSGQFYYGFPRWWSSEEWIKLANRVPKFHNTGMDTEYNVSKICRVAEDFFIKYGGSTPEDQKEFRDKFYADIEELLIGQNGKRKVVFDECTVGLDGKLIPWIEFEAIEKQLTGKEYTELYQAAVMAFANASGILAGLVGVNDGKMLGGSGSELRVSAEYQQFYRTPRERQSVISFFERVIKPSLKLPKDVHFGFKNILLETLNQNKAGSSTKPSTAAGTGPKTKQNA